MTIKPSPFLTSAKVRPKSLLIPSAQFEKLCKPDSMDLSLLNNVLYYIGQDSHAPFIYKLLVDLLLSGGLRISEVLNPTGFKINMLGQVYIHGLKGSNAKLVTSLFFRDYWLKNKPYLYNPFMHISRFGAYRLFKQNELFILNTNRCNNSVTHCIRHLSVHLNQLMELPPDELSRLLGHKSYTAINYYLYGKKN